MKAAHNNGRKTQDPMDVLRRDIACLKDDVATIVNGRLSDIGNRARDTWNSGVETVQDAAGQARDRAMAAQKQLANNVKARPMRSVAIAFAAGAVGAMLFDRLKSR